MRCSVLLCQPKHGKLKKRWFKLRMIPLMVWPQESGRGTSPERCASQIESRPAQSTSTTISMPPPNHPSAVSSSRATAEKTVGKACAAICRPSQFGWLPTLTSLIRSPSECEQEVDQFFCIQSNPTFKDRTVTEKVEIPCKTL